MRSRCICASLVFALAILTACGGGGSSSGKQTPAPSLSSIAVTPATVTLIAGQTQQLTATATYSDGSTANVTATTTWSSSNANVATVTPSGLMTATTAGQAVITATASAIKGSSALTVNAKVVTSVSITPETQTLFLNSTQQFDAVAVYNDGSAQDITTTTQWQSSEPDYATVSNAGIVTAVAAGNVTISAATSDGSVSSSANVTVTSSNTGVTMIDDLTDSRLMLYWPGDGSVVTYSGTRNADGTFAAINGATVTAPPAANQPNQVFTFDSQGRESTDTFSDGTLIGFNWTANPTMVITPPNQAPVVVPLPATGTTASAARAAQQHASLHPPKSNDLTYAPLVSVNVTTDLGAGAKPEDNAQVNVYVSYPFGGSPMPAPIPAMETSPGSGQYSLTLASGPSDLSPAILQSSASKAFAAICHLSLAAVCADFPAVCLAAAGVKAICGVQSVIQDPYSVVNFFNGEATPNIEAETDPNGCGWNQDAELVAGTSRSELFTFTAAAQCTPSKISINPNPVTTSVGGTVGLGASASWKHNGNPTPITSSTLNWAWAAGSGVPSLTDSHLQITPIGTNTPLGWLGGKFGVGLASVIGQNATPAGVPDTVAAVEVNSNTSGTSAVTVQGSIMGSWSGSVTWDAPNGQTIGTTMGIISSSTSPLSISFCFTGCEYDNYSGSAQLGDKLTFTIYLVNDTNPPTQPFFTFTGTASNGTLSGTMCENANGNLGGSNICGSLSMTQYP
jgi:uncharacterized protein YjdB